MDSNSDEPWPLRLRITLGAAAAFAPAIIRGWYATLRLRIVNPRMDRYTREKPVIGALWHNHFLTWCYYHGGHDYLIMVSRSRDGEVVTRILHRLGFRTVRGSSSRRGGEALAELIEDARHGRHAALLVDGPRGPARAAKIGVVVAARDTGLPIMPCVAVAERAWTLRNWDRTVIPVPGSRVAIHYGSPIFVPRDTDREACEKMRTDLDATMAGLEREASAWLARHAE